jgi:hypothetical protein
MTGFASDIAMCFDWIRIRHCYVLQQPKQTCKIRTLSDHLASSANAFIDTSTRSKEFTQQIASLSASGECRIDGTARVCSFAVKGRALDIRLERTGTGEASLQCLESVRNNSASNCILKEEDTEVTLKNTVKLKNTRRRR